MLMLNKLKFGGISDLYRLGNYIQNILNINIDFQAQTINVFSVGAFIMRQCYVSLSWSTCKILYSIITRTVIQISSSIPYYK